MTNLTRSTIAAVVASTALAAAYGWQAPTPVKRTTLAAVPTGQSCSFKKHLSTQEYVFTNSSSSPPTTLKSSRTGDFEKGPLNVARSVERGGEVLYEMKGTVSRNLDKDLSFTFGKSFTGLSRATVKTTGKTAQVTLSGRALAPLAIGQPVVASSIKFIDKKPAPLIKIDQKELSKIIALNKQAQGQIATCVGQAKQENRRAGIPAAPGSAHPPAKGKHVLPADGEADACQFACKITGDSCSCCETCCAVPFALCENTALAALAACEDATSGAASVICVLSYYFAAATCMNELPNCLNGCAGSAACCGAVCAEGHASQDCPAPHCSEGAVCCGGQSCCNSDGDCCGKTCLEGNYAGNTCVDPTKGVFCPVDHGDLCGGGCCPSNQPTCRQTSNSQGICCAAGSGDVCMHGTACCPSSSPKCINNEFCCGRDEVICGRSICCPAGSCNAGTCCKAPNFSCGNDCCNPDQGQVCTHKRNRCCGGTLNLTSKQCGDDCCGPDEVCLNGTSCCPKGQACGSACCPNGQGCINGKCASGCPRGQDFCRGLDGTQMCCNLYQCNNPPDNVCVEDCCAGGCCGPTQACCANRVTGRIQCSNPADCRIR